MAAHDSPRFAGRLRRCVTRWQDRAVKAGVSAILVLAVACGGGTTAADQPSAAVQCEWADAAGAGTPFKTHITVTSPLALDTIEVQVTAVSQDGEPLEEGIQTYRYEGIGAGEPTTFDEEFRQTHGWPEDADCAATVENFVEAS